MRHTIVLATLGAALLAAPTTANADDDEFEYTSYSFDDDMVGGDTTGPMGEILQTRGRLARESLVRVRRNFVPELLKSIEQL